MTPTTVHRVFNFAAGPAVMPLPVLEERMTQFIAEERARATSQAQQ